MPSLVPSPVRSYAEICLVGIVLSCVLLAGCLVVLLCRQRYAEVRTRESAEAVSKSRYQETVFMIERCKGYVASAEEFISRQKSNKESWLAPVAVLRSLQGALPEQSWIDSFRVSGDAVELVITTNSQAISGGLIDRVVAIGMLLEAHLESIERVQSDERFLYETRISAKMNGKRF